MEPYLKGSKDISEEERKRYNKTKKRGRGRENKGQYWQKLTISKVTKKGRGTRSLQVYKISIQPK